MKIHKYLSALALCFIFSGVANAQGYRIKFNSVNELRGFLKFSKNRVPLLSAHRGGPDAGFPENCIETFSNTIKYQPTIIEFDVSLTKDSVLAITHDNDLERTTNGSGKVSDYTYQELRKLSLEDNFGKLTRYKIPTLDDVLKWAKNKVILTIDVKRGVPYKKIVEAVYRNNAQAYSVVITYNANQTKEVHDLAPDLMISASIRGKEDLDRLLDMNIKKENLIAFVGTSELAKNNYTFLHQEGIICMLGTMGNLDKSAAAISDSRYYQFISNGADFLSSDRWKQAGKQITKYIEDNGLKSKHITREGEIIYN